MEKDGKKSKKYSLKNQIRKVLSQLQRLTMLSNAGVIRKTICHPRFCAAQNAMKRDFPTYRITISTMNFKVRNLKEF